MATRTKAFDRTRQDVGNVLSMEHVNVCVPDQQLATAFYIGALGFTRDPYISVGLDNIWANTGRQQMHLPTRPQPQVIRGHVGIVVPDVAALQQRLAAAEPLLAGTQYAWSAGGGTVEVTGPWGNRFHCMGAGDAFEGMQIGIPYLSLNVPVGTADGIARFYRQVMGAPASVSVNALGQTEASVRIGPAQSLRFAEDAAEPPAYDGHHVAIYVTDFSGPHAALDAQGLITEETNEHQYRFVTIFDPESGRALFNLEHEVRSATHPMFMRPLANRNPAVTLLDYVRGGEALGIG